MIVYGDPAYDAPLGALLGGLRERLATLRRGAPHLPLDDLRALLIQAGEVEQAAADSLPDHTALVAVLQTATDGAADAFLLRWRGRDDEAAAPLAAMEAALRGVEAPAGARVTVKVPEGFAFYALYPEQYVGAAEAWLANQEADAPRRAAVVGIRSIGTTLSAVAAAALRAAGCQTARLTVRPSGHPYERTAEIAADALAGAAHALVVDEGPGQSGSSMAAAAAALERAGISRGRIAFLPSHEGGPGESAPENARAWWGSARQYVVAREALRWNERDLAAVLRSCAEGLPAVGGPVARVEDCGGGLWRGPVYGDPARWPAVPVAFERPKWLCIARSGRAVLWKYAGLGIADCGLRIADWIPGPAGATRIGAGLLAKNMPILSAVEDAIARQERRARAGWSPPPLGAVRGFVATPWVEGVPLTRADGDADTLAQVGRYVAEAAGAPLSRAEREAGFHRLRELLFWNVWEVFGKEAAERTRALANEASAHLDAQDARAYGDGRVGPVEWLRAADGRLVKTDVWGHASDHTAIGPQPLAWDVAGALAEWDLSATQAAALLAACEAAGAAPCHPVVLHFYRAAYAAFRLGQLTLCASLVGHDPDDQQRLYAAIPYWRRSVVEVER